MKKILILLAFVTLTAGCRHDSGSAVAPQNETPSKPVASTSNNNNTQGGGVDSSGGNLLLSSEEQVDEAVKDIETKVRFAVLRLTMEFPQTEKLNFEERYGDDTYKLARDFVGTSGKVGEIAASALKKHQINFVVTNEPCTGEHQAKDGSASWIGDKPTVCLSKVGLRKLSPKGLQQDVIALAVHELSHLYGYNEERAQALQKFMVQNYGLVWPDKNILQQLSDDLDMVYYNYLEAMDSYTANQATLCENLRKLQTSTARFLKYADPNSPREDLKIPSAALQSGVVFAAVGTLASMCGKAKDEDIKREVANMFPVFFNVIQKSRAYTGLFINPDKHPIYMNAMTFMNTYAFFEDIQRYSKDTTVMTKKIRVEDLVCSVSSGRNGDFSAPLIRNGSVFFSQNGSEIGSIGFPQDVTDSKSDPSFVLRKMANQRGVGLSLASATFKVTSQNGFTPTDGGDEVDMYSKTFLPGDNDVVQLEAKNEAGLSIRAVCGILRDGKKPDLTYKPIEEKTGSSTDRDPSEDHFKAKLTTGTLSIQLNQRGSPSVPGGWSAPTEKLKQIKFNGHVVLDGETHSCVISEDLILKKKMNPLKLAQDIRDGKIRDIYCDMNGDVDHDGNYHTAPWAFDFSVRP